MSLKDQLLDLSAHNWLHIVAAVCIGILLYQNHHQKLLIEQQSAAGSELTTRVMRDTGTAIAVFLHEELLHPYQFKEGEYRCRYGGKSQFSQIVTYSYALPEETGQELLSREEQFRNKLARDFLIFKGFTRNGTSACAKVYTRRS